MLAIDPGVRGLVYRRERLRIGAIEIVGWLLILAVLHAITVAIFRLPGTDAFRLGGYPRPQGWLQLLDLTFGIALVAFHEELFFRRAMRAALARLGDGAAMIIVSAAFFGAYHWWGGPVQVCTTAAFGVIAMLFYRRSGALWPVVLAHYLTDLAAFMGV